MLVLGGVGGFYEAGTPVWPTSAVWSMGYPLPGYSTLDLDPQPSILSLQPSTPNPQPSTLIPHPSTINPQPLTLNLALESAVWAVPVRGC